MERLLPHLKNKFVVVSALFLVWMMFFDKNDWITQIKLKQQLRGIEKEKAYYQAQAEQVKADSKDLFTDPQKLEKFAREEYLMKKDNEDLFVIVEEEK